MTDRVIPYYKWRQVWHSVSSDERNQLISESEAESVTYDVQMKIGALYSIEQMESVG